MNVNTEELKIIESIVSRAIALGYDISVYADGEEPEEILESIDKEAILKSLGAACYDRLVISKNGEYAGFIMLTYGNFDPEEVVCDHTDNTIINQIVGSNND